MAAHPARGRATSREPRLPGFVGRDREMSTLQRALRSGPAVVLLEGEAGVGKSRLVQEFLARHPEHRALIGVCPPFRESLTLGAIVDAVRHARESVADLSLSGLAGALRPLFPEWAAQLPPAPEPLDDPTAAQHRLFRALAELIERMSVTVLVVEDVHWADPVTMDFVLFLAYRLPQPVSLVVTYRPEDVAPESPLRRLSSRLPATTTQVRISLQPLDLAATTSMVSSMLDSQPISAELARFLHERTDGLPLAVEESVRLLHERADLVRRDGAWTRAGAGELQVPPTIRDAVLERVARLPDAAHRVLHACAVLAEPTDSAVVLEVAGLSGDEARTGLTETVACGLLREDDDAKLSFRHVLPRRAVYEAIPAVERQRLHARAGEALERLDPPPVLRLTRHFRAAHQSERWSRYAERAAELAVASGDHATATVLLTDLLAGAELSVPTRVRVLRKLALAAMFRRDAVDDRHDSIVRLLRTTLETEQLTPAQDAELRSSLGWLLAQAGEWEAARAELEAAVPHLDHEPAEQARTMAFLGVPFIGNRPAEVHLQWLQRAAGIDQEKLTPAERLGLTADRAGGLLQLGDEAGWQVAAQLPSTAATVEERRQIVRGQLNVGSAAIRWGRYAYARQRLLAALSLAEADGYLRVRGKILIALVQLDWYTGVWDRLAARAGAVAEPGSQDAVTYQAATRLGAWHLAQGAWRKAEEELHRALEGAQRTGAVDDVLEPAAALARMRLADGRVSEAIKLTDEPIATVLTKGVWLWATDLAPVRVEALVAAGSVDDAAGLLDAYQKGVRGRDIPTAVAAIAACRGHVAAGRGDHEAAARFFAEEAAAWQRLPRPYDAALAQERQARSLLALGRTEEALEVLNAAFAQLSGLGARGDGNRLAELIRTHGGETPRTWRRGRRGYGNQLSPRELEVVRQLVTGRTNREIADALSRSPKTVAGQLSSAMRKLGVTSRTALAVAVMDAGLVPEHPTDPAPGATSDTDR